MTTVLMSLNLVSSLRVIKTLFSIFFPCGRYNLLPYCLSSIYGITIYTNNCIIPIIACIGFHHLTRYNITGTLLGTGRLVKCYFLYTDFRFLALVREILKNTGWYFTGVNILIRTKVPE